MEQKELEPTIIVEEHFVALNPVNLEYIEKDNIYNGAKAVLWLRDFHTKCEFSVLSADIRDDNGLTDYLFETKTTLSKPDPNLIVKFIFYTWTDGQQKIVGQPDGDEEDGLEWFAYLREHKDKHGKVVHPTCHIRTRVLKKRTAEDRPVWPLIGDENDVKLVVAEEEFVVDKLFLMSISPVFRAMFTHKMSRKIKKISQVEIKDASSEDFRAFLEALSSQQIQPNGANLLGVLKLADKYQIDSLKKRCAEWMAHAVEIPLIERFIAAEKFALNGLNEFFLENLVNNGLSKFFTDNSAALEAEGIDYKKTERVALCGEL